VCGCRFSHCSQNKKTDAHRQYKQEEQSFKRKKGQAKKRSFLAWGGAFSLASPFNLVPPFSYFPFSALGIVKLTITSSSILQSAFLFCKLP
jgi:hypothetical protein